jgi:hypothetical protein
VSQIIITAVRLRGNWTGELWDTEVVVVDNADRPIEEWAYRTKVCGFGSSHPVMQLGEMGYR